MHGLVSSCFWLGAIFCLGYVAIILEPLIKINKTSIAILSAISCWVLYILFSHTSVVEDLARLQHDVSGVAQILFFLLAVMAIVELIDVHKGFELITRMIKTSSKRKLLWIVAFLTFFLSAVLDNLTTTILMVSLLKKLIPEKTERFLPACLVVIAANAGGAWTPIGDVTTTMLWIGGQITSIATMKSLFLPSLTSLLIPLGIFTTQVRGKFRIVKPAPDKSIKDPGVFIVLIVGLAGLVFIPAFKAYTGLPPFMGAMFSLAVLWLITDLIHRKDEGRSHLTVPSVLAKIDISSILFFLGILLAVAALDIGGILAYVAKTLDFFSSKAVIATLIGIISAIIDNVPLVAATMGMYPLKEFPVDSPIWQMIAYAAGTGGSLLIIGSASGVALMGMEKIDFLTYAKRVALPVLIGYLAGMVVYLLF